MRPNPVRARLIADAREWLRSSVHVHLSGANDGVTAPGSSSERFPGPTDLLGRDPDGEGKNRLRRAESIGRRRAARRSWRGSRRSSVARSNPGSAGQYRRESREPQNSSLVHCHRNCAPFAAGCPFCRSALASCGAAPVKTGKPGESTAAHGAQCPPAPRCSIPAPIPRGARVEHGTDR